MIPVGMQNWPGPPGITVKSFLEDPKLRLGPGDRRKRATKWVRSIILHTTWGVPSVVEKGVGPDNRSDYNLVDFYNREEKHNGCHAGIDTDGSVGFYADCLTEVTYHAQSINEVSVGIEIKQIPIKDKSGKVVKGRVWEAQLEAAAGVVDVLCRLLGIQRQFHGPYSGVVPRLARGGIDCVGVFGHRDQTVRKGVGDPGDEVFHYLSDKGYVEYDFNKNHDKMAWLPRQAIMALKFLDVMVDGVPGPATVSALRKSGYPSGLWVPASF